MTTVKRSLAVDGIEPSAVVSPSSAEEVARALAAAAEQKQAVIPVGGGRALGMGNPPRAYDLALDLTALNRIVEHSQHDLTVTAEAGVTLEDLQAQLATAGQFLPLDPFASPGHTIGGLLATGWTGPLRLRYGSARDFLIGLAVALPDGNVVRSGGKVVKNVSGYDMNKLHYGALGSLGVIVEATFKVFPRPFHEATVQTTVSDAAFAFREALRATSLKQPAAAVEMLPEAAGWRLVARLAGSEQGVERMRAELGWEAGEQSWWEGHAQASSGSWAKISAEPAMLPEIVEMLAGARLVVEPAIGLLHWLDATDLETVRRIRGAVSQRGGSLVLLAAEPDLKRGADAWGPEPNGIAVMRELKQAFDPAHTLSPGRYVV